MTPPLDTNNTSNIVALPREMAFARCGGIGCSSRRSRSRHRASEDGHVVTVVAPQQMVSTMLPLLLLIITTLVALPAPVDGQDACSTWVPLNCGGYTADSTTAIAACALQNRTASNAFNSFDTSLRPTSPTSSLTYCDQRQVYDFVVPANVRNTTRTVVTLIGALASAQASNPRHDARVHVVTNDGIEYSLGTMVHGYNAVIGQQRQLSRPLPSYLPPNVHAYPFNGVLVCSNQAAYQPWRIPSALQAQGIARIRIYDPAAVLKVYSITIDTCDSYAGVSSLVDVDTYLGDHASNASITVDTAQLGVSLADTNLINAWPLCAAACYAQQTSASSPCVAYALNSTSRQCYLLASMSLLGFPMPPVSNASFAWVGVLPPRGVTKAGGSFAAGNAAARFPAAMFTRPDLLGGYSQSVVFMYRADVRRFQRIFLRGTTRYALSLTQPAASFLTRNYVAAWAAQYPSGAGGRIAVCGGNALSPEIAGAPFVNNNTIARCTDFGHCVPQAVGTNPGSMDGRVETFFQESPLSSSTCGAVGGVATPIGMLMQVSYDGSFFQGGTYALATVVPTTQSTSATLTSLVAYHYAASSAAVTLTERTTYSLVSAATQSLILYQVDGLTGANAFQAPQWFWTDSDQHPRSASVHCVLETALSYRVVAGNQGLPSSRYRCNATSSLMALVDACNQDWNCTGVTTLAVNSTAEVPWCMVSSATVETVDASALNPDATLLVKAWNSTSANALRCAFPTYGSYGVTVRVAQGFTNGTIRVLADGSPVATCPAVTGTPGESSCALYRDCFVGNLPRESMLLTVELDPGFPLGIQCSTTLMKAFVTFDLFAVAPVPSSACTTAVNASYCSAAVGDKGTLSETLSNGSTTCGGRLSAGIRDPTTYCNTGAASDAAISFTLPTNPVIQTLYLSVDVSNVSAVSRGAAQLSVVATDGLNRKALLGYIVASAASAGTSQTIKSVAVGWSPYDTDPLCSNATTSALEGDAQMVQLPISRLLFVNGITGISIRGANVSVRLVSGLIANTAGCPLPLRRNVSASELAFYFVVPGVVPTTGAVIATQATADFTACGMLCAENTLCGVYTYTGDNASCVLRNGAGRWKPSSWPLSTATVVSGTKARSAFARAFSTVFGATDFVTTVANLFSQNQYVVLFAGQTIPDANSMVVQLPGMTGYQIAALQTALGTDGAIVSGVESYGAAQVCGNLFDPFLATGDAGSNLCTTFMTCKRVTPTVASSSPLHISISFSNASGGATSCSQRLFGFVGYSGSAALSTSAIFARVDIQAPGAAVTGGALGSVVTDSFLVTYKGASQRFVLRESSLVHPATLTQGGSSQTSYCKIVTKTNFEVLQLRGFATGTAYACGTHLTIAAAVAACTADKACMGFTVSASNTVGCLTTSAVTNLAPTMFLRKVSTTSCAFQVTTFSVVSVSVLDVNLYQGSGNNVYVKWNGRVVRTCGSSRPFLSGYSTATGPRCATYLECFNDILPGVGTLEVVFPDAASPACDVFQAAVAVITPQQAGSQALGTNAARVLPSVRSIKYSSQDLSFSFLQQGATRVAVLVKQDRFFAVSTVQTFALNVSIGSQAMSLCGGTVGFAEGAGLDSQCTTYFYCGPVTQNAPVAYPAVSGPITVVMANESLRATTNCNSRFDAVVLTDGMLLSGMPSQSYFRMLFAYVVSSANYSALHGGSDANVVAALKANITALGLMYPSMNASRVVVYSSLFPYFPTVTSAATEYVALLDDIYTTEETKILGAGRVACVVDRLSDETMDSGCEIRLEASQNKITVSVAQSNFNLIGRTVSVVVDDVTVATCGGDNLFLGYQGLSGLCNNYFVCYDNWVTPGALVRLVFSQTMVSTSLCVPAALAFLDATSTPYIEPINCTTATAPFACNADRVCLARDLVCNDISDCSDRSDEGRCRNWRFAGTNLAMGGCDPRQVVLQTTREECIRSAVIAQTPTVFLYNASACTLYDCVDYSAPNVAVVTDPGVSFEAWIYTTDASSFLYCTDALHCNNNGVVASTVPPCTCTCLKDYTGDGCASQLELHLIDSIVGVLAPGVGVNNSVTTAYTSALLSYLPTGSIVSLSGLEVVTSNASSNATAYGMFVLVTDFTGARLTTFTLASLLVYATRANIVARVPGLESITAASVVGPVGRVTCYKSSFAVEGTSCASTVDVNNTRSVFVTVVGISFTASTQYVDVSVTSDAGDNTTVRCEASDFTQYRDTTLAGVCSYRSVCTKELVGVRAKNLTVTASPTVNPGNIICSGYMLVASARVIGSIRSPFGSMLTADTPTYDTSHNVGYTIITAALGSIGLLCCGLLIAWFRVRRKYERIKYLGPLFAFFAFAFVFGAMCGLAFYVGSEEEAFSHMVVVEEYRDLNCGRSFFSSIPTRVSYLNAKAPTCAFLDSIGPAEGLNYAAVEVFANGTMPYAHFRHGPKAACAGTTAAVVPLDTCVLESVLFPEKNSWELSYVYVSAYTLANGAARIEDTAIYNPTLRLTTVATTQIVSAGERYNAPTDSYRYFLNGNLGTQLVLLNGDEDHFALLDVSQVPAAIRQNAASPEYVRFRAVIVTEPTAFSSSQQFVVDSTPFVVTRENISSVGTSFNHFNSTDDNNLETSGPYATAYYSFFGVRGGAIDAGLNDGFTVSFWLQATSHTRGFVYAVVDGWVVSLDYTSRIMERLWSSVENGATKNPWFERDWHCYHAVYVSGQSASISFVTASPEHGLVNAVWDMGQLGLQRVFDEGWHYINVVVDNSVPTSPTARLYVDGETRRDEEGWHQCINKPVQGIRHRGEGTDASVINNRQESVKDDGTLIIGALNARLFDFSIQSSPLTQDAIVREGAPGMELYSAIARAESLGLGIATLLFALVNIFITGRHIYNHFFGVELEDSGSDDDLSRVPVTSQQTGDEDITEAAQTIGGNGITAIFNQSVPFYQFIQPLVLTIQVMALYMYAWEWPKAYSDQFFPGFAIVSIDFHVAFPSTSPVTWPLIQFALASILLLLLVALSWRDRDAFHNIVLSFTELLRLRQRKANPFGVHGVAESRGAKPVYQWIAHTADGGTQGLTEEQEETLLRSLQAMMARRLKTDANMRLHTPRLVDMGALGVGIILYERLNGKVFISFRASDRTAQADREASNIILTQTTLECVADNSKCPEHDLMLLPDDLMQYSCVHSSNPYYRSMECPRRCVMYACPHELCDYAVCEYCYNGGTVKAAVSGAIAAFNHLKRRGFFVMAGMALVELASVVYLPVVKSAMMVLGCHAVYVCTFGACWSDIGWEYALALIFAFTAIIFFGGGYFVINALVTAERHLLLRASLPHRPALRRMFQCLPEYYVREVDYDDFMQLDETLLVTLYQPFRFNHQWFPVILYVFRFVLPASIFVLDSGGLGQLVAAVVLEVFLSLAVVIAAPFKSIWIELCSRLGSIHQFVLLGLMSLHRVYVRDNPGNVGYGNQMVAATMVYLFLVAFLLVLIVIVPAIQRAVEARRRKSKEEDNGHRDENYDIGVWGDYKSRTMKEMEAKKKHAAENRLDDFTKV